jgi:hypothetical protein
MSKIVSITLKLDDKVTKPLRKVQAKFDGFINQKFGWSKKVSQSFSGLSKASGLSKLAGATGNLGSAFGNVGREAMGLGKSLVGLTGIAGLGAGGLLALVKQTSAVGDGLVNTAKRIGFGVEAFQEFQYAAEQNGMSAQDFSKSIEGFTRRLGELKAGEGTLALFLKKTNPELMKQVIGAKSSEEAFELMINKLGGMQDATKKAAFANYLFGKSGQRLINVADQGADGIAALRAEARALGVMTAQEAEDANKFGDTIASIEVAFASIRNVLAVALIPELQKLADQFKSFLMANKGEMQKFAKVFADKLPGALRTIGEEFNRLAAIVSPIIAAFQWLGDTFGYTNTILGILAATIGKGLVIALFGAAKAAMAFGAALLTTPIGWISLGIAGLVGGLYLLWSNWDSIWKGIKSVTSSVVDWLVDSFDKIIAKFSGIKALLPSWLGGKTTAEVNVNNRSSGNDAINNYAQTQTIKNESQIKVSFDNLPKGARVDSAGSKNVETDVRMGLMGVSTI